MNRRKIKFSPGTAIDSKPLTARARARAHVFPTHPVCLRVYVNPHVPLRENAERERERERAEERKREKRMEMKAREGEGERERDAH